MLRKLTAMLADGSTPFRIEYGRRPLGASSYRSDTQQGPTPQNKVTDVLVQTGQQIWLRQAGEHGGGRHKCRK
ncbi:hypothetical protein MJ524_26465 [Escherichia coli]|nr:hypothetical protein MJ524_26465 [Escherichia coli]